MEATIWQVTATPTIRPIATIIMAVGVHSNISPDDYFYGNNSVNIRY